MAPQRPVRLDHRGIEITLTSPEFAAAVNAAAGAIAAEIGPDALVDEYTTDRRAAAVTVPAERQTRDGALTRAAARAGLDVKAAAS